MTEQQLAQKLSNYMQLKHPTQLFHFDTGADIFTNKTSAMRMSKLQGKNSKGHPDFILYLPTKKYGALFIELKITSPFKKDGTLKKNKHLETQNKYHQILRNKGYKVEFGTGFDECVKIIEDYISTS